MNVLVSPILEIAGLNKVWHSGGQPAPVLRNLELNIAPGERVAVMGASGSGKTTLLNLVAGIDTADGGSIRLLGRPLDTLREPELTRFRAAGIGLVFQDFNLMETLTVAENIELPLWLAGRDKRDARVREVAEELGIAQLLHRFPPTLSGGEQQRAAIARALVHRPGLILADEPTGSLDQTTAKNVLNALSAATGTHEVALLLATHSNTAANICHKTYRLRDGSLTPHSEPTTQNPQP